jgi:hypothetical protein
MIVKQRSISEGAHCCPNDTQAKLEAVIPPADGAIYCSIQRPLYAFAVMGRGA